MYDWCSGTCLWSVNEAAHSKYGYPVSLDKLPFSKELREELEYLANKHDEALDWDDPGKDDPIVWSEQQRADFIDRATKAYHRIVVELGDDFEVELLENCLI